MTYFFSQIKLRTNYPRTTDFVELALKGQAYRDHALIWKLFSEPAGHERDFIFRRLDDGRSYYVVSARKPVIEAVNDIFEVRTKPYMPFLQEGQKVFFDLRANPTVSISAGKDSQGKNLKKFHHDIFMHAKSKIGDIQPKNMQLHLEAVGKEWIFERAQKWGLKLYEDSLMQNARVQHRIWNKGRGIQFSSVDYSGVAQVLDAQKIQKILLEGVGRSKSFGCGLLLVKPF